MDDVPSVDDLPDVVDPRGIISFRRAVSALGPLLRSKRAPMPDGRPTVTFGTPQPIDRPKPAPMAPTGPMAVSPAKPARTPRARPAVAPAAPPVIDPESLESRADAIRDERDDLVEQSEANAFTLKVARATLAGAGRRATPAMLDAVLVAEAEDSRLVKLWLDAGKRLAKIEREIKRAV